MQTLWSSCMAPNAHRTSGILLVDLGLLVDVRCMKVSLCWVPRVLRGK